jgi:DNA-binding NarL/FixJ family response regulator
MIQVFLVEDQDIIRRGLKTLLTANPEIQVMGEAAHGQDAIAQLMNLKKGDPFPDLILMDIRMPEMDGVEATRQILQTFPTIKILILTTFDDTQYVQEALQFGAKGYLLKDTPADELAKAIQSVHQGFTQFGPGILEKALSQDPKPVLEVPEEVPSGLLELSPRERDVLKLMVDGARNKEIAEILFISEGTVRNHVSNILTRLNVRDRTQAAIIAKSFPEYFEAVTHHYVENL